MKESDEMVELIKKRYESASDDLNAFLDRIDGGLPEKLRALRLHQLATGFIRDDLAEVTRCRIVDSTRTRHFLVQYNPRRVQRQAGIGRSWPPTGLACVNDGCFLCPENIWWQQCGTEIGYPVTLNDRGYIAWTNPFTLKEAHYTIATAGHVAQSWSDHGGLQEMLEDLIELAQRLPGFPVFYNGDGAGASIPRHRHFQCFGRDDREPFPLEKAAEEPPHGEGVVVRDYPLTALHFRGTQADRSAIVATLDRWLSAWTSVCSPGTVSANVVVTADTTTAGGRDVFRLYFIPRNRRYSRGPGMTGLVGGLEAIGELVFSTDAEKERLDAGVVDYGYVHRILAAVEAPGVADFLRRVRA